MRERKTGEADAPLIEQLLKLLAGRCVYASQILAGARDAAGSTCCSCFLFGGVLSSRAFLSPIEAMQSS